MDEPQHTAGVPAGVRVVTLPAEIDYPGAERVSQDLAAAFMPGVTTVIADLSSSVFCDTAGIREMIVAHRRAAASNIAFRLVVPTSLARIFAVTGLTGVLAIYPTLAAALAAGQAPEDATPSRQPPRPGPPQTATTL
jgi:anti-sigma B factor antagonist